MKEILYLSPLHKTWIFDLDGTLIKHNGYMSGKDELLPGVKNLFKMVDVDDFVIILTSRLESYRGITENFLKENDIRYNKIFFDIPTGERIVFNDNKKSGLRMAYAISCERDLGLEDIKVVIDDKL
jgi:hypothetical protein